MYQNNNSCCVSYFFNCTSVVRCVRNQTRSLHSRDHAKLRTMGRSMRNIANCQCRQLRSSSTRLFFSEKSSKISCKINIDYKIKVVGGWSQNESFGGVSTPFL